MKLKEKVLLLATEMYILRAELVCDLVNYVGML